MGKTIILAKRPDLVMQLEKYGLLPETKKGGIYEGCAKKWAKDGTPPYDNPEYQALAERIPTGWEELTYEELDALLAKLHHVIGKKKKGKLDTSDTGGRKMLKGLAQIAYLAMTTVAELLVEHGIGILPDSDEKEKKIAKEFSFELILHLIIGSDALTQIFRKVAQTLQTTKQNQQLIAEVLATIGLFLAITAASHGDEEKMKRLLLSFNEPFSKTIDKAERFVSEKLNEEAIVGDRAERAALYLQQARIALERQDFNGFYETFSSALETMQVDPGLFIEDIKELNTFAKKMHTSLTAGMNDGQLSRVSQAM